MTKRERHYVNEILMGLGLILLGVILTMLMNGDVTALVFIGLIAGLYIVGNVYMLYYYRMKLNKRRQRRA